MTKIAVPLAVLAVAGLGGCTTYEVNRPAGTFPQATVAPQPMAYRTGSGTITRVATSPSYVASAAAGGSTTVTTGQPLNRLTIRMDNGTMQYLDTDSTGFSTGMRVELLPDHTIRPL